MTLYKSITLACALVIGSSFLYGKDPFHQSLVPPELIIGKADYLELTDEQIIAIKEKMKATHEKMKSSHEGVKRLHEALAKELLEVPVDTEKAASALKDLLQAENELKIAQFLTYLDVRNLLTKEQLGKVKEIMEKMPPPDPKLHHAMQTRIQPKLKRVHKKLKENAEGGTPPSEDMGEMMEKLHILIKSEKLDDAEALLDKMGSDLGL